MRDQPRNATFSPRAGAMVAAFSLRTGTVLAAFALLAGGFAVPATVAAHHGPGAYDRSQSIAVTGTVTRFEFVNPHVLIYVAVETDSGDPTVWAGELTSPNRLARMGGEVSWHKDLLRPGDVVTLTGSPARNGAPALLLSRVEDGAGRVLTSSGR